MKSFFLQFAAWAARRLPVPVKQALYRLPYLSGLLRRALNRAAPHGLTRIAVAAGGLQGVELLLDLQSEKDYWLGTYEPDLQTAIQEWVKPAMQVYDVGANIGYISLLLARRVGQVGQIFAFEALPANQQRLRANLQTSGLGDRVQVIAAAVVDAARPVQFLVGPSGGMGKAQGSAGRQDVRYGERLEVEGLSLDHFVYQLGNPAPQVVKMDIEGGETLALPGMQRLLQEARPLLLMELHGQEAAQAAWQILTGAGYRITRMQPGYPAVHSLADLDWKAYLVAQPQAEKV